jgi:26S proteasome regulatory subunit N10
MTRAGTRGVQVASLALKHRQNKHQRQRIIIFVGSPLNEDQKDLVKLGMKLKKNDVAVDVINFGETAENQEKLEAFIGAVNKNENSSLLTVPPGPHILSDIIISSSICNSDGDGGGGGGMGAGSFDVGGGGGAGGFDAELAMVLRISAEEERQRQEREAARIAGEGGAAAPAEGGATATPAAMGAAMADDEDDMLQQALAMSMAESQPKPAATTPKSEVPASASKAADAMEEDEDEELKLAMAMSQGAAGGDASGGMNGLLQDAGFLNDVLSSLPGVDTSDPRV